MAYLFGAVLVLPVLLRNRYPRFELIACSVLLLLYYTFDRRDISPAPLLSVPLYDAAVAGFLVAAIIIPSIYMAIGLFVVEVSNHYGVVALINSFLPSIVVLALAIMLGDAVRTRRALAAETAERLRMADEEREAEAARRVAEERLRIARDLHDTVAHSMATITVQAGSALHVLGDRDEKLRGALTAIRETSKHALREMRATLGQLRQGAVAMAAELRPDVVLMDLRMPEVDGLTATKRISGDARLGGVRVVVLTTFDDDEHVFGALRAGASGFLVKDVEPEELLQAVRVVARGDALLAPSVTRSLIAAFTAGRAGPGPGDGTGAHSRGGPAARPRAEPGAPPGLATLTDREREVVALVAEGLSNDEIAARLVVSPLTAKTHVSRAMTKPAARDRAQLVVLAYTHGLAAPSA